MIGSLTLDQLRVLVAVAEEGSFSAAGRRLGRAQSAMSQAVAGLEGVQGVALFDRSGFRPVPTDAGRALIAQARAVLAGAARFEAMAAATRDGVEPELAIAIDPLVPTAAFVDGLAALREAYPHLPVSFSTEGLRGAERRLRRGEADLAFCVLLPVVPDDVAALPLAELELIPVAARDHPLALLGRAATRTDLDEHVQLILSDPADRDGPDYGIVSPRRWRFVDLARRVDFLVAGLGWCRMPHALVAGMIADGQLVRIAIADEAAGANRVTIYAAHLRDRPPGRAATWLLGDLRARLTAGLAENRSAG